MLEEWTHTFESPLFPKGRPGHLDVWTEAISDNRAMARSVWQDLAAIQGRTPRVCLPSDNGTGREIVYPGALYPNLVDYISYDATDFLQAEGDIALACPADLETKSAALQYILRECGKERIISLRPQVGEVPTIPQEITDISTQSVHLLVVRANQRTPLIVDDYLRCMAQRIERLADKRFTTVHLPIMDPERPAFSLVNLYHAIMNFSAGTDIRVVLHNRVYVSVLSVGLDSFY